MSARMSDRTARVPADFLEQAGLINVSEQVRIWIDALEYTIPAVEAEIDEVKGAIDNERIWSHGSQTPDEARMHLDNEEDLREYLDCLRELLSRLWKGDTSPFPSRRRERMGV